MNKTLLVFDIDDTITKSESQHQTAFVNAMLQLGITTIDQNWSTYKNMTDSYILKENFSRNLSDTFDAKFIQTFEKEMMQHLRQLQPVQEINGAANMLQKIANEAQYCTCFATGSFLQPALRKLKQANVQFEEAIVVGSNENFERESIVKEAINSAKKHYNCDQFEHIIAFGDGMWDLKTAKNLGIHFVGIGQAHLPSFKKEQIKYWLKDWTTFSLLEMKKNLGIS